MVGMHIDAMHIHSLCINESTCIPLNQCVYIYIYIYIYMYMYIYDESMWIALNECAFHVHGMLNERAATHCNTLHTGMPINSVLECTLIHSANRFNAQAMPMRSILRARCK